jgi:hypothetical protein
MLYGSLSDRDFKHGAMLCWKGIQLIIKEGGEMV